MRILLTPIGTHGDVHPFVGLGIELTRRGHDVVVITNEMFKPMVERAGLSFVAFGTESEFREIMDNPAVWHPIEGIKLLMRFTALGIKPLYELVADRYVSGNTVIVNSPLALGARLVQEKLGAPLATIHLAPSSLCSVKLPLFIPNVWVPRWTPTLVKVAAHWMGDRFLAQPIIGGTMNAVRAELGLPGMRWPLRDWWNSPQRIIAMFPDWFGAMGSDWPTQVRLCTFPLFDERGLVELPGDLEAFLDAGDPPILFTPGSGMKHGQAFFRAAVEACQALGKRAILLTLHANHVPDRLPDSIRHFTYIPFSQVFPRSAAIVHHGGIGTTAQGLAAGVPQLIMPMAYDQPDNADRLKQLGVGSDLPVKRFTAANVAAALRQLLRPEVRQRCQEVAARFAKQRPFERACALIEEMATDSDPKPSVASAAYAT